MDDKGDRTRCHSMVGNDHLNQRAAARSSVEAPVMGVKRRGIVMQNYVTEVQPVQEAVVQT